MLEPLSRRRLLEAAGGITFLALVPNGRGAFATVSQTTKSPQNAPGDTGATALPLFTALPYLQPGRGTGSPVVADGQEHMTLAWQTNLRPAAFSVAISKGKTLAEGASKITPERTQRTVGTAEDAEGFYDYAAHFSGLDAGVRYAYRVTMAGQTIADGYFTTRKKRGQKLRFVAFGDNSYGEISDRMIAYQTYQARPEFVMNTGDNVYEDGLVNEYARYFFPVYNANVAEPRVGAPLLRSVPFYTVIANHDVHGKDENKHPVADFNLNPDALGYYSCMHLPLNGPTPSQPTPTSGKPDLVDGFKKAAGNRFPRMANYSFDYGDAHFLCLDSNIYVDTSDKALQAWVEKDLAASTAPWKFVVYHHPAFNVGKEHYAEQQMRVLTPLFEKHGVTFVLSGHEHNYQRTRPFTFAPTDTKNASNLGTKNRQVPGTFTVDRTFDGKTVTVPKGIMYVTTGAGGKHLYDADGNNSPEKWRHEPDNNVEYVARMVSDRHSLTVFDMDAESLTLTQVDQWGSEIEKVRVTKG